MKPQLTLEILKIEVQNFINSISFLNVKELYGVNDGKAVGTYVEHSLKDYLLSKYHLQPGNSANGIDFPDLEVDLKVTSIKQPQSSCPFRDAKQKIYGLGYHLLVLVYDKTDIPDEKVAQMKFQSVFFIEKNRTGDYQTTKGILSILEKNGNQDDIESFLIERNLPLDEIGVVRLAKQILENPPIEGYLTISNALQWRLQYQRAMNLAQEIMNNPNNVNPIQGIENLFR